MQTSAEWTAGRSRWILWSLFLPRGEHSELSSFMCKGSQLLYINFLYSYGLCCVICFWLVGKTESELGCFLSFLLVNVVMFKFAFGSFEMWWLVSELLDGFVSIQITIILILLLLIITSPLIFAGRWKLLPGCWEFCEQEGKLII